MRLVGHVTRLRKRNAYSLLVGKPEDKDLDGWIIIKWINLAQGPPLLPSGRSSWLQIRRPGFDSRHYQKKSSGSGTGSAQPRKYN
jgi:hypothetical protein